MKLTGKQEKFAQGIAKGLSQADAYREAYNCKDMQDGGVYREACLLINNPKITQRIEELRKRNLEKNYDRNVRYYLEKLERIAQKAEAESQYAAAISALKEDAKISGVYVEKSETKNNVEIRQALVRFIDGNDSGNTD